MPSEPILARRGVRVGEPTTISDDSELPAPKSKTLSLSSSACSGKADVSLPRQTLMLRVFSWRKAGCCFWANNERKRWHDTCCPNCRANSRPRTELPCKSSRGLKAQIPATLGTTMTKRPLTPLLAGTPTSKLNCPLYVYSPHEYMSERQSQTMSSESTRSLVTGQTPGYQVRTQTQSNLPRCIPPAASVAAMTAIVSHVAVIEQAWKYSSSVFSMLVFGGSTLFSLR
jgi:hypothetical protein